MSLLRVRHNLSPFTEGALIVLAIGYGIFAMYLASVKPLVVALTTDIHSVPEPPSLETGAWQGMTSISGRFIAGIPNGWIVDTTGLDRIVIARDRQHVLNGAPAAIVIETRYVGEDVRVEDIVVSEISGSRPALYDISVHGRPGLFVVEFMDGRIVRQTVYVGIGERVHIFRAGNLDPAVFSAFISTVKFLPDVEP